MDVAQHTITLLPQKVPRKDKGSRHRLGRPYPLVRRAICGSETHQGGQASAWLSSLSADGGWAVEALVGCKAGFSPGGLWAGEQRSFCSSCLCLQRHPIMSPPSDWVW